MKVIVVKPQGLQVQTIRFLGWLLLILAIADLLGTLAVMLPLVGALRLKFGEVIVGLVLVAATAGPLAFLGLANLWRSPDIAVDGNIIQARVPLLGSLGLVRTYRREDVTGILEVRRLLSPLPVLMLKKGSVFNWAYGASIGVFRPVIYLTNLRPADLERLQTAIPIVLR